MRTATRCFVIGDSTPQDLFEALRSSDRPLARCGIFVEIDGHTTISVKQVYAVRVCPSDGGGWLSFAAEDHFGRHMLVHGYNPVTGEASVEMLDIGQTVRLTVSDS